MKNYLELEQYSLLYDHFAFVDVPGYYADQLFIRQDRNRFLSALSDLNRKMILCGYPGYEEFCASFITKMYDGAKALRKERCKSDEAHPIGEAKQTCSERAS